MNRPVWIPIRYAPAEVCTEDAVLGLHAARKAGEDAIAEEYAKTHTIIDVGHDMGLQMLVYRLASGEVKYGPAYDKRFVLPLGWIWSPYNEEQFKAYNP